MKTKSLVCLMPALLFILFTSGCMTRGKDQVVSEGPGFKHTSDRSYFHLASPPPPQLPGPYSALPVYQAPAAPTYQVPPGYQLVPISSQLHVQTTATQRPQLYMCEGRYYIKVQNGTGFVYQLYDPSTVAPVQYIQRPQQQVVYVQAPQRQVVYVQTPTYQYYDYWPRPLLNFSFGLGSRGHHQHHYPQHHPHHRSHNAGRH